MVIFYVDFSQGLLNQYESTNKKKTWWQQIEAVTGGVL